MPLAAWRQRQECQITTPLFYSFRVMAGVGLLMLAVSWLARWKPRPNSGRAEPSPALTWVLFAMPF